ncbi:MAG: MBL fold metallo-hydrolase [Chloroflexi bacterium]|nr:MBL fold metallo-hydrolase [Chloroflexota bacterium]
MSIKLTFLGAAQNVTGSCYLLEVNRKRFLVDCGLYQERELKGRNWAPFFVSPESLDAVLLTHAHLDHCGLLPKLVREGCRCPIYCTTVTKELAEITLVDAAHLQEEDAEFKRKRHEKEGRKGPYPDVPLYTCDDARAVFPQLSPADYGQTVKLAKGIEATFHDAGHVLGSAMLEFRIRAGGEEKVVVFSGDIGGWDKPILHDPTLFEEADYVLVESTYGDRLLERSEVMATELAEVINSTRKANGNIVIPSFALERTQEVLFYLNQLLLDDAIPHLMVFVDSPMAVSITEVFKNHLELFDESLVRLMEQGRSPFDFPGLKLVRTIDDSKAINHITGTVIIIAGSGMCTGGRIKHHLVTNITRPESTILFVGYQAVGTLGRQILDGAASVRILGQQYPVQARVLQINGFSSHADREHLYNWLANLRRPPRQVFVTHGEPASSQHLAALVRERTGWAVTVPQFRDEVVLG